MKCCLLPEAEVGWWVRIYITIPQDNRFYHCKFHFNESQFITLLNTPGYGDLSRHVPCMDQDKDQDMEQNVHHNILWSTQSVWITGFITVFSIQVARSHDPYEQMEACILCILLHRTLAVTEIMMLKLKWKIFISLCSVQTFYLKIM